jgi:hypothetical protein
MAARQPGPGGRDARIRSLTRHLALVRHSILAKHDSDQERVHNSSDINSAKIDWARDMGENQNISATGKYGLWMASAHRRSWNLIRCAQSGRCECELSRLLN